LHFSGKKIVSLAQKFFGANPSHPAIYRPAEHDDEMPEKQVVFAMPALWQCSILEIYRSSA
jgi:hypothetical protein